MNCNPILVKTAELFCDLVTAPKSLAVDLAMIKAGIIREELRKAIAFEHSKGLECRNQEITDLCETMLLYAASGCHLTGNYLHQQMAEKVLDIIYK